MKKVILLIFLTFICTGCYNYKELNELGIVSAMGISKDGDLYNLDIQLLNVLDSEKSGLNKSPITVISGQGETIFEAARSMNKKTSKVFFLADVDYVFLDQSVLNDGLDEIIDFLIRDTRLSLNFLVVTSTENKSLDILSSISHFDTNSANNLYDAIMNSETRYGGINSLHVRELINNYYAKGKYTLFPNVYIKDTSKSSENDSLEDSKSESYVEVKNMVFFKDKEAIELTDEETKGVNFLRNKIKNATLTIECDGGYFTIETLESKMKLKSKLNIDQLNVKGNVGAEIVYYGCKDNLDNADVLKSISKKAEKEVESYITKAFNKSKKYNYDFLGLGNYIYKNNYKYFDFENKDWNKDGLNKLNLKYNIDVSLYKQGNLRGDL
ncbi:germination protein Ger(X)C family [Clostridium sp. CAG:628]|nr:germination protein Ger(X)C family [Clostridium sp. CAG:628]